MLPAWEGIDPALAEQLEAAVRLGLATDPARRPATPGEFVERLRAGWGATLPTGVTTFCLSDIVGSTELWERDPGAMAEALVRHDELIAAAVESHGGRFLKSKGEGDATFSVFESASDAVAAAIAATRALGAEQWPSGWEMAVRFGIHTGEAERTGADYLGPTVNLAARVRGQADEREILLSQLAADLTAEHLPEGYSLVDLGAHRLRGVEGAQTLHAVAGPGVTAPLPATECPYRGLLAFDADDREFFFGREHVLALGARTARAAAPARARRSVGQREVLTASRRPDRVGRRRRKYPESRLPGCCSQVRIRPRRSTATPRRSSSSTSSRSSTRSATTPEHGSASSTHCSPTRDRWRSACAPTSTAS